jgi:hypothetical protein
MPKESLKEGPGLAYKLKAWSREKVSQRRSIERGRSASFMTRDVASENMETLDMFFQKAHEDYL